MASLWLQLLNNPISKYDFKEQGNLFFFILTYRVENNFMDEIK